MYHESAIKYYYYYYFARRDHARNTRFGSLPCGLANSKKKLEEPDKRTKWRNQPFPTLFLAAAHPLQLCFLHVANQSWWLWNATNRNAFIGRVLYSRFNKAVLCFESFAAHLVSDQWSVLQHTGWEALRYAQIQEIVETVSKW